MSTLNGVDPDSNAPKPAQRWLWQLARGYAFLHGWVKDHTGFAPSGLGLLLRQLKTDREFNACGFRWQFDHRIATTYMRLVGGRFNEPETQSFLRYVADQLNGGFTFIDVGANIGEMVLAMAAHPNVQRVIGFEPHPVCNQVARRQLQLNAVAAHAEVRAAVVGDGSEQAYVVDDNYAPTSGIRSDAGLPRKRTARLDDELQVGGPCVLLIDVEGAELGVLRGASHLVQTAKPLIIFEYHAITRQSYSLEDVAVVLGAGYELLRLRLDGYLDADLTDTYNVFACPRATRFAEICKRRLTRRR